MDAPYYTATVTSLVDYGSGAPSWSYTHEDVPDPGDPVHLTDQMTYSWAFENVVPGQMVPAVASYGLWCQTALDVPPFQIGDLQQLVINVDVAGVVVIEKVMKIAAVEVTLTPDEPDDFSVYVSVTLVDPLADLRSLTVQAPLGAAAYGIHGPRSEARQWWRPRVAEVGKLIARSIGCPTWWDDDEQPDPGLADGSPHPVAYRGLAVIDRDVNSWAEKSAFELLTQLLNSHQPDGITHTIAPAYNTGYPSGYEYVHSTVDSTNWPNITDPDSDLRYLAVPASRESGSHAAITIDADWCDIPAKARRAREHVINTVNVGVRANVAPEGSTDYKITDTTMPFVDAGDLATFGPSPRDLPTQLTGFQFPVPGSGVYTPLAPAEVAPRFLSDASARDAGWTYDAFQLVSSRIPQSTAETLLPIIAPRVPGETDGDGQVLRHVTLVNLDPSVEFGAWVDEIGPEPPVFVPTPVTGFLVAGSLTVAGGDLVWNLTLTPGEPT